MSDPGDTRVEVPYNLYDLVDRAGHEPIALGGCKTLARIDMGHAMDDVKSYAIGLDSAPSELNYETLTSENGRHLHLSKKCTPLDKGYSLNMVVDVPVKNSP